MGKNDVKGVVHLADQELGGKKSKTKKNKNKGEAKGAQRRLQDGTATGPCGGGCGGILGKGRPQGFYVGGSSFLRGAPKVVFSLLNLSQPRTV